jgi:hypothetical protein
MPPETSKSRASLRRSRSAAASSGGSSSSSWADMKVAIEKAPLLVESGNAGERFAALMPRGEFVDIDCATLGGGGPPWRAARSARTPARISRPSGKKRFRRSAGSLAFLLRTQRAQRARQSTDWPIFGTPSCRLSAYRRERLELHFRAGAGIDPPRKLRDSLAGRGFRCGPLGLALTPHAGTVV